MTDALAEAVAKAEAELAAIPTHVWYVAFSARGGTTIYSLGATMTLERAKEKATERAKVPLTWNSDGTTTFTSDFIRAKIKGEYQDVRYSIVQTPLDPK